MERTRKKGTIAHFHIASLIAQLLTNSFSEEQYSHLGVEINTQVFLGFKDNRFFSFLLVLREFYTTYFGHIQSSTPLQILFLTHWLLCLFFFFLLKSIKHSLCCLYKPRCVCCMTLEHPQLIRATLWRTFTRLASKTFVPTDRACAVPVSLIYCLLNDCIRQWTQKQLVFSASIYHSLCSLLISILK